MSVVFLDLFGKLNGPFLQSKLPKLATDLSFQRGENDGRMDFNASRSGGIPIQWGRYVFDP